MDVEILAIGNEILLGSTVNTNATFISQELLKIGIPVNRHTVLPDEEETLSKGMREVLERSALVICTGGLGPTCDDITRKVAAALFSSDFHYDKEVADHLISRFGREPASLKDQATIPSKAKVFKNSVGTAPGLTFTSESATLILLPGVPVEMRAMLTEQVLPYLQERFPEAHTRATRWVNFCLLPEAMIDPALRAVKDKYPQIDVGIYPSQGTVSVRLMASAESRVKAEAMLEKPYREMLDAFPDHLFHAPSRQIEEAVHELFIDQKLTLSLAESCTGGAISSSLTKLPGASNYFLGSVVSYSNDLKMKLLGVSPKTLQEHGAVSEETVKEMVAGLLQRTGSDYGLAVSGIAGPDGGTANKPVGTVCLAIGRQGTPPKAWTLNLNGSRESIIIRSVTISLGKLFINVRGSRGAAPSSGDCRFQIR